MLFTTKDHKTTVNNKTPMYEITCKKWINIQKHTTDYDRIMENEKI